MILLVFFVASCLTGFVLFSRIRLKEQEGVPDKNDKVSVIIPARNEENNLPILLKSLQEQTRKPYEIIVVDDFSTDRTYEIAESFGVKVIRNTELPENWTGKTWAVWNGFQNALGEIMVFLDADVRLTPDALRVLLQARDRVKGAVSVVPYHTAPRFYEKLSLILYILGVFAFTSPFEQRSRKKGLYGSCIVVSREDYEKINGHDGIRSELLDDLNLGKKLSGAGVSIENYIGYRYVSFRMYPGGLRSELQGFGKGAILSTATLRPMTILLIAIWIIGLLLSGFITPVLLLMGNSYAVFFGAAYLMYTLQFYYFLRYSGTYGILMPLLHPISSAFFIVVMLYSAYQVTFRGSVSWKGRQVKV
jgi:glycosyltransferase involved in cell wall biosynthesis